MHPGASRCAIVLLLTAVISSGCRSIAGYGAADPDTWHGGLDQRPPPDLAHDAPADSGPSDGVPSDSIASEPSVSSDGPTNDQHELRDLKQAPIPDATGCTNPHPIQLTTDCTTQVANCTTGALPDADCDGIPGAGQPSELDPLNGCNLLTQQNECNTNWPGATSDGCRVTLQPSGGDYDTGIVVPTLKDTLVLAHIQTGVLAPNSTVELVAVVNVSLRVRCFVEGSGNGKAQLRTVVVQGSTNYNAATLAALLPAGDHLLALWASGGAYYCALADPAGVLRYVVARTTAPIINSVTDIKMRTSGVASARVDYLRVFKY